MKYDINDFKIDYSDKDFENQIDQSNVSNGIPIITTNLDLLFNSKEKINIKKIKSKNWKVL